jgi:hypothetical protein
LRTFARRDALCRGGTLGGVCRPEPFRTAFQENYGCHVPPALVKYWTGHAKSTDGEVDRQTITDRYIKMAKDTKFRADVAERIGLLRTTDAPFSGADFNCPADNPPLWERTVAQAFGKSEKLA